MSRAILVGLVALLALPGCATFTIKPVDFSWSFESVMTADADGFVRGEPKTVAFNAGELYREESGGRETAAGKIVRVIRDAEGYYFVTAPGFRHVYVLEGKRGKLVQEKKVLVDENGMEKPFFNLRDGGIELVANGKVYLLNRKGIVTGGKK